MKKIFVMMAVVALCASCGNRAPKVEPENEVVETVVDSSEVTVDSLVVE